MEIVYPVTRKLGVRWTKPPRKPAVSIAPHASAISVQKPMWFDLVLAAFPPRTNPWLLMPFEKPCPIEDILDCPNRRPASSALLPRTAAGSVQGTHCSQRGRISRYLTASVLLIRPARIFESNTQSLLTHRKNPHPSIQSFNHSIIHLRIHRPENRAVREIPHHTRHRT